MMPTYCKRIQDAAKLATAGPWLVQKSSFAGDWVARLVKDAPRAASFGIVCVPDKWDNEATPDKTANLAFIATTRTDAPKAARAVEIAVEVLERLSERTGYCLQSPDCKNNYCPSCEAAKALAEISKLEEA